MKQIITSKLLICLLLFGAMGVKDGLSFSLFKKSPEEQAAADAKKKESDANKKKVDAIKKVTAAYTAHSKFINDNLEAMTKKLVKSDLFKSILTTLALVDENNYRDKEVIMKSKIKELKAAVTSDFKVFGKELSEMLGQKTAKKTPVPQSLVKTAIDAANLKEIPNKKDQIKETTLTALITKLAKAHQQFIKELVDALEASVNSVVRCAREIAIEKRSGMASETRMLSATT